MDNKRLVFDRGNQWRDAPTAPFFVVPGWWRRFIFSVLSAREFVVYAYLCSVFDRNAVAYPTIEQIAGDVGIKSRVIVARAIEALVEHGFIMRGPSLIRGRLLSRRPVYQRPHPAYTLLTLLDNGDIDEDLFPLERKTPNAGDFAQRAVELGLKNLLGNDLFNAYALASDNIRSAVLHESLARRLHDAREEMGARDVRFTDLPEEVSALIAEDQKVPF